MGKVAEKSTELARFMAEMAKRQVDDDARSGIDNYYDIDDEFETLIVGSQHLTTTLLQESHRP